MSTHDKIIEVTVVQGSIVVDNRAVDPCAPGQNSRGGYSVLEISFNADPILNQHKRVGAGQQWP